MADLEVLVLLGVVSWGSAYLLAILLQCSVDVQFWPQLVAH